MELQIIQSKIYEIRGQRVMLDADLAEMYGVETKRLKEAVRRNIERFEGDDFMIQLTKEEITELSRSQIASLNTRRGGNIKYAPFAFSELGVAMLSSVLNSKSAIEINRGIMRAFVAIRNLVINISPSDEIKELRIEIKAIKEYVEDILSDVNDINEETRKDIDDIHIALCEMAANNNNNKTPRKRIGFIQSDE